MLGASVQTRSRVLELYLGTEAVIGQARARKELAVLLDRQCEVRDGKRERAGGAIVSGPTGVGKTHLVKMMCGLEEADLIFADTDATQYTESGYAGMDLSQMFMPLLEAAARVKDEEAPHRFLASTAQAQESVIEIEPDGLLKLRQRKVDSDTASVLQRDDIEDIKERAECGVLLLDEFDKWMARYNHHNGRLDTAVQAELLKMIEGSTVYVSDDEAELGVSFDTSRVLILCGGAFVGLMDKVARNTGLPRENLKYNDQLWENLRPEDFISYGMLPELSGRLATHVLLRPLRPKDLAEIMMLPGGLVEEFRERFEARGIEWQIPPEALTSLAEAALSREIGARGIGHVLGRAFTLALFEAEMREDAKAVTLAVNEPKARII